MKVKICYIIIGILIISNCFLAALHIYDLKKGQYTYREETIYITDGERIEYDEEYAVKLAAIVYSQMYGKEYSEDDFYIESKDDFSGNPCWVVKSKEVMDTYTSALAFHDNFLERLFIDKKCGAIVAYFKEEPYE